MGKSEQSYQPIRNSSDDEESSTHTSTQWDGTAKFTRRLRAPSNKLLTKILLLFIILNASMLVVNVYSLTNRSREINLEDGLYTQLVPSSMYLHHPGHQNEILTELPVPVETVTFEEQHVYASAPNTESDKAWENLLPVSFNTSLPCLKNTDRALQPGRGYVFIKDGQNNGLQEPGEITPYGEIYSVAVFHQIHCLGMLRGTYWELLNQSFAQDDLPSLKMFAEKHIRNSHVNHCFDYLRQSLQCAADMSLEWPVSGTKNVDGWGVPHLCKSWVSLVFSCVWKGRLVIRSLCTHIS